MNDKVRIINGEEVIKNSFPWQVSIRYRAERLAFCGGSIVNEKWVLTAAHCMMDEPTRSKRGQNCFAAVPNLEVYAGTHTKDGHDQKLDINAQRKKVSKFCMHPKWDDVEIYGDAALLEMQTPFYFNDFVIPICLPSPSGTPLPKDTMCVITGFGRTQGTANERVMNQATLPIVENKQCNRWLGAGTIPDSSQMCAGFEKGGVDTCQGDSGGPLACKHGEQWFIDGITSWGYGCGDARSPGVYTRVASPVILSWIQKITQIDIQQMRRGN